MSAISLPFFGLICGSFPQHNRSVFISFISVISGKIFGCGSGGAAISTAGVFQNIWFRFPTHKSLVLP